MSTAQVWAIFVWSGGGWTAVGSGVCFFGAAGDFARDFVVCGGTGALGDLGYVRGNGAREEFFVVGIAGQDDVDQSGELGCAIWSLLGIGVVGGRGRVFWKECGGVGGDFLDLGGCAGGAVLGSGDGICEIEKKRRITQRRRVRRGSQRSCIRRRILLSGWNGHDVSSLTCRGWFVGGGTIC